MGFAVTRLAVLASTLVSAVFLTGCATERPLMPTPTIYQGSDAEPVFTAVSSQRRRPAVDLLYFTDRAPETDPKSTLPYGPGRSKKIAFGSVVVEMGPDLNWSELKRQSRLGQRTAPVNLTLGPVTELGRFPATPYRLETTAQGIIRHPDIMAEHLQAKNAVTAALERRLEQSARKEVVLYIHGVNTDFETAAFTIADLCHFLGREHVCAMYTWPAGAGGWTLSAYGYDRESSEFGAFQLKKVIRLLADSPKVEKLHLLAHSRGTDVLLSALRELGLEVYVSGRGLEALKLETVVLFAPDIDVDVAAQRMNPIASDPDMYTAGSTDRLPLDNLFRLSVYVSTADQALRGANILFRSQRVGRAFTESASPEGLAFFEHVEFLDIIQIPPGRQDVLGHGYFTNNPHVSSDVVSLIRYGLEPGDPGRQLTPVLAPVFWKIRPEQKAAQDEAGAF